MDSRLLLTGTLAVVPYLYCIFNRFMLEGIVPNDFKTARVSSVYKGKGSHSDRTTMTDQYHVYYTWLNFGNKKGHGHASETALENVITQPLDSTNESLILGACYFDHIVYVLSLKCLKQLTIIS